MPVRSNGLLKQGSERVRHSGVFLPLMLWSLIGLACWYYVGSGMLSPIAHRIPATPQSLGTNGWVALTNEVLTFAKQSGWFGLAGMILLLRMVLSPAVDAWIYHRLAGRSGQPAWTGFYGLNLVLLLGVGLVGWVLYVHVDALLNLLSQPLLILGWGLVMAIVLFLVGLVLSWYKLRLSERARVLWPRLGLWAKLALVQLLLSLLFGLIIAVLQYFSMSSAGVLLIILLALTTLVRLYGKLWKMACVILALQR